MKKEIADSSLHTIATIVVFLAVSIICSGCCSPLQPIHEGVEVVPLTQHPLFPLETGRFWVYKTYSYWYGGGIESDKLLRIDSSESSYVIMCDTLVRHNNKIYRAVLFNIDRDFPYWSDSNQAGYFHTLSITPGTTYFRKFLHYPIQKGDTFQIKRAFAPFGKVEIWAQPIECIGTNEDIRVPAGNFKCYGFRFEPRTFDGHGLFPGIDHSYYALNIGRIMSLTTLNEQILSRTVLIRYGSFRNP